MTFQNPVLGGETLVRDAAQSENYEQGADGWRWGRDGSVEANDGTFRGDVNIGPAGQNYVVTKTVPAELASYYAGLTIVYAVLAHMTGGYAYDIAYKMSPVVTGVSRASGVVRGTTVYEISNGSFWQFGTQLDASLDLLNVVPSSLTGFTFNIGPQAGPPSRAGGPNGAALNFFNVAADFGHAGNPGEDLRWSGTSLPRGAVYFERITNVVNSGAVAGVESVVFTTTNPVVFPAGRACEVTICVKLNSAVVQQPICDLRWQNAGGVKFIRAARVDLDVINQDRQAWREDVLVNTGGTDASRTLALCVAPSVATAVTLNGAPAPDPSYIKVVDVGAAAAYPGALAV